MKIAVEIEWDWPINPADKHWLCADNIALALHSYCRNTKFVVHESTADVAALRAKNAALKAECIRVCELRFQATNEIYYITYNAGVQDCIAAIKDLGTRHE